MDPGSANDLHTARLSLHAVDLGEAQRIVDMRPGPDDWWAEDYPFEGDLGALARALEDGASDPRPFGYYRISRRADGRAIGGIGFKGAPVDAVLEVGYGLAPSARGHGYGAEALRALLGAVLELGVKTVRADTTSDNVASQRTLERAGFRIVRCDEQGHYFEVTLGGDTGRGNASEPRADARDDREAQTRGQG